MNTKQLEKYAPAARKAFIASVTAQAAKMGVTAKETLPAKVEGDVLLVAGQAYPSAMAEPRTKLVQRIAADGFEPTMDAIAYTWFNRLAAIRYMELHGYLDHGYRVLSHPEGEGRPEILDRAADLDMPGLDSAKVIELKLDGAKDEELYRLLLLAQCNALHQAMPFLFEQIGDETELLLPANLLHTDSLVRQMVEQVDEDLWQDIEVIGWLYQFYISEKKDQVIGKVVKSEDIPAATQLFTPNWIVKYMVQNSLGAQWLATYPDSPLKGKMQYYIEPAEQTDEVNAQLAAITPSSLDPEELTLIDPASGSGHILVEAYELFKAIYLERGYRQRDVAKVILEKNLFGLDIDPRAAQLTGFALMMKGRADDRRLFERGVELNVMALVDSGGFDTDLVATKLLSSERAELVASNELFPEEQVQRNLSVPVARDSEAEALRSLVGLFEHATTFGSLIEVPETLAEQLPALKKLSDGTSQDLFVSKAIERLGPLVRQAELLAVQYDVAVTNPPYMGSKGMPPSLKQYAEERFRSGKGDLFSCFMERAQALVRTSGRYAMITMPSWLFLSTFASLRVNMLRVSDLTSLLHMGRGIFGIDFGSTAFVVHKRTGSASMGRYFRLHKRNFQHIHIGDIAELFRRSLRDSMYCYDFDAYRSKEFGTTIPIRSMLSGDRLCFQARQSDFERIPGSPVAYWLPGDILSLFGKTESLDELIELKAGMSTGNNDIYQRKWFEVDFQRITFSYPECKERWVPCSSGGEYRKWFGNNETIVDWEGDGVRIKRHRNAKGLIGSAVRNEDFYFRPGLSWSKISSGRFAARWADSGFAFDDTGRTGFMKNESIARATVIAVMVSNLAHIVLGALTPTMSFTSGELAKLPVPRTVDGAIRDAAAKAVELARTDWDLFERSWAFDRFPLMQHTLTRLESTVHEFERSARTMTQELFEVEGMTNEAINRLAGVETVPAKVPAEQITLTVNPAYRYGGKLTEEEQWTRFRNDTMEELVSYAIGCMMGRYSLDAPGLIYAHSGNEGFDATKYRTFPADDDGIVPITDTAWFEDDACRRFVEFMSVAWDVTHLEDNLTFVANNLSPKKNEASRDTIRRFLRNSFFKDHHLKRYKKRPIYWLFSSGKQKTFQCLVYLHRYNEGTLARMRSEYVIPLQGKMAARIDKLTGDIQATTASAPRKRLEKELTKLEKQQVELLTFDEKLRHYADRRIKLDLDDGVKVNYGKFGDLLAEVKTVHGKNPESA